MPISKATKPDPVLLQTLQKMMGGPPGRGNSERRHARRYTYRATQFLAPYSRGGLPADGDFREVRCQDLSTGGIAFYWPTAPDFDDVVIQLGTRRSPIFVTAHITSVRPSGETPDEVLVGCQFTGRVQVGT